MHLHPNTCAALTAAFRSIDADADDTASEQWPVKVLRGTIEVATESWQTAKNADELAEEEMLAVMFHIIYTYIVHDQPTLQLRLYYAASLLLILHISDDEDPSILRMYYACFRDCDKTSVKQYSDTIFRYILHESRALFRICTDHDNCVSNTRRRFFGYSRRESTKRLCI